MKLGRRAFLKLGGSAAVAATGYAGYEDVNGGKWLFDPALVTLSMALSESSVGFLGSLGGPAGGGVADAISAGIDAWFAELAAGAISGTIDTETMLDQSQEANVPQSTPTGFSRV